MKKLIGSDIGTYTFNATTGQITLSGLADYLTLSQLLLITNVTDNIIIYNFANPSLGATISNNVITLEYNTSSMSNDDALMIFVEIRDNIDELLELQRRQIKILESLGTVDASNRQRVAVEAMPSTAVTNTAGIGPADTVNTGTAPYALASRNANYVMLGPISYLWEVMEQSHISYAINVRSNLSFN